MEELQRVEDDGVVWRCGEKGRGGGYSWDWLQERKKRWSGMKERGQQGGGNGGERRWRRVEQQSGGESCMRWRKWCEGCWKREAEMAGSLLGFHLERERWLATMGCDWCGVERWWQLMLQPGCCLISGGVKGIARAGEWNWRREEQGVRGFFFRVRKNNGRVGDARWWR
ncbi:hypothetical protein AMTR_s00014p00178890 [Amborella trichopoda]|uniref:Uncharacterized protein n=1 Tax=Amborella trichopoda TaxID=13333 RepID=W1PPL9_AMBTC|nr:hypothetical protein AMTR_s00014p00178890 [Amborella trichopoda]